MNTTKLSVPEIHCGHCKNTIEGAVKAMPGVDAVEVAIENATVEVAYDDRIIDLDTIKAVIEEQGYAVSG